jgi:all-trans-retinol dehydrogenase (NAD+)
MSQIKDKLVLVTGAASGIGRNLCFRLKKEGAKTILAVDINARGLEALQADLDPEHKLLKRFICDLSQLSQVEELCQKIREQNLTPDILINNAGIIVGSYFWEHSAADIEKTMAVNVTALMHLTRGLLPSMIPRGSGHIANVASAAGYVGNPKMSVYCASKWAVIGWSESLRLEMEELPGEFHVTTVTPYYVNTGMFDGVRSLIPILSVEKISTAIIKGIKQNSLFVREPFLIRLLPLIKGLLSPRLFDLIVGRWLGVYKTMEHFQGRK